METSTGKQRRFTRNLMDWHRTHNDRSLPWKGEKDPYRIWLSEVILQQTRAQQGIPYYLKFLEAFPDIHAMAAAEDEAVFRLWQGLGYYNRCRNMLATARYLARECGGIFPGSYELLLGLKGIGPYTAAAIGSFAFGLPLAVVDGNVYRVLARHFGIELSPGSSEGKKIFQSLADALPDPADSAGYNQAIMDLGATVCTPAAPKCTLCPVLENCFAYRHEATSLLPVRVKKQPVRKRYFHYLLFRTPAHVWIRKREGKDIWRDLYEPWLLETDAPVDERRIAEEEIIRQWKLPPEHIRFEGASTQRLTHQLIETRFFSVHLPELRPVQEDHGSWIEWTALKNYAFPKTLVSFFEKKQYF